MFREAARDAAARFGENYHAYFTRNNAGQATPKKALDPLPRVILAPVRRAAPVMPRAVRPVPKDAAF